MNKEKGKVKFYSTSTQRRYFLISMLAPAILMLAFFTIYPFVVNLKNSFFHYNLTEPYNRYFVGGNNYFRLIQDKLFWQSFLRTLYFVSGAVSIEFLLGLGIAYLLKDDFRGRNFFRIAFILPMGATPIAISFVWKIMLNPSLGIINYLLRILGLQGLDWVGNPRSVIPSLILIDVWCWTPFMMLILLAGFLSLPKEPFEAAEIEGASTLQSFFYIALPLLKPLILVALLFRIIDAFRTFDIIFVITAGGPGHYSETLNILTYLQGFKFLHISYASTLAIAMLIILIVICMFITRLRAIREIWSV